MAATQKSSTQRGDSSGRSKRHTYVIDTSVLLSDPYALKRFDEHEVVVPVVVVTELEGKRHHPELGFFARTALRFLDDLRISHGRLDEPVPVGTAAARSASSSTTPTPTSCPRNSARGTRGWDNDSRILAVARNLQAEGREVTLVSKDLPMRVKASAVGLAAEEYRAGSVVESGWTGMAEVDATGADLDALYERGCRRPRQRPRSAVPHRARPAQ